MKRMTFIVLIVTVLLATACTPQLVFPQTATETPIGMPNPASKFCVDQGYKLEIRTEAGGEVGYCLFPDGSECEEWAFYRGECAPGGVQVEPTPQAAATQVPEAGLTPQPTQAQQARAGLPNPASQSCVDQGGSLSIEKRPDGGEYGVCLFEDNRQCEEWALLRGDCPVGGIKITGYLTPAARFCAISGGEYAITGKSGAEDEQGTCTLPDGTQCDVWEFWKYGCPSGAAATPAPPQGAPGADAGQIAFSSNRGGDYYHLFTINVDGSELTQITDGDSTSQPGSWSPDGTQIAFTWWGLTNSDVSVINADGSAETNLTNLPDAADADPAWSPDGTQIAFTSHRDRNNEVYVMNADGSDPVRLTDNPTDDFDPAWSPDGSRIVFCSDRDRELGVYDLYIMNADGSGVTRLTDDEAINYHPDWSPDGTQIAFRSHSGGPADIYVINVDGSGLRNLTQDPSDDWAPAWSPDGTQVAFQTNRDGNWEIYAINADGSDAVNLTQDPANDQNPVWQPKDGSAASTPPADSEKDAAGDAAAYGSEAAAAGAEVGDVADGVPLKDALDSLEPKQVWQNFYDLTQVPRPSHHEEQVRAFLVEFGKNLGLETTVDSAGNVLIHKPAAAGQEGRKGVILQAHMDIVPQETDDMVHDFTKDPIDAYVVGEWVTADRTTLGADDGIGVATIMAVLQSDTLAAGPIEGLFTVNEEDGMDGALGLKPGVLHGDILINLDWETEGSFCIGSAGGELATVEAGYTQIDTPPGVAAYQVVVQGLKGGHSGVDINRGRGHATKLLVRLLQGAAEEYRLLLAGIEGGTAHNAIPKEATALVAVPESQVDAFKQHVDEFEGIVQKELAAVEPDLTVEAVPADLPAQVMDEHGQSTLLDILDGLPQGVMRMSDAVPGLVETSINLGVVQAQDGELAAKAHARSSLDSSLDDVGQMFASVWDLGGIGVTFVGRYPGWQPDPDSEILGLMQEAYQDLYGQKAEEVAVHAGLELGVIHANYPDLDTISMGPTLVDVHTPDERLEITSVKKLMDLLVETLERIPEG